MDHDPLRDSYTYGSTYSTDREARDFGLAFVTEGWLEEHVRTMGSD
ncbi:hypothetical protein [Frondihabitans cladoniiphilus]|uniref:Uncharacterized protein n=1 Tax=Frondihabitans cladoniiphilus TaxID=715785 RepID=A0ABP8VQ97_9MICO